MRYLKGAIDYALHLLASPKLTLEGYSDASFVDSIKDRKITGGSCMFFGQSLISCSSHKQQVVSRSSSESKYCVLANLAAKV